MEQETYGPPIDLHARIAELRRADPNWGTDLRRSRAVDRGQRLYYWQRYQEQRPPAIDEVALTQRIQRIQLQVERNEAAVASLAQRATATMRKLPIQTRLPIQPPSGARLPGIAREFS